MGRIAFYAFDALVHWLPLLILHVPFEGFVVNAIGFVPNLAWGVAVTGGSMDLSETYVPLPMYKWWGLWGVVLVTTVLVPF